MVDVVMSVDIHEPKWLAERLGVEKQVHLSNGDILIEKNGETWGIERKTWTDALNSWMKKRLEKQVVELSSVVDHAFLLIQHEPERRLQGGNSNTYERFKRHTPNLKRHLNRLCAEVCPVIYCDDASTAVKEIMRLKERIEQDKFGSITIYDHNVRHQDPHTSVFDERSKSRYHKSEEYQATICFLEGLDRTLTRIKSNDSQQE